MDDLEIKTGETILMAVLKLQARIKRLESAVNQLFFLFFMGILTILGFLIWINLKQIGVF